MSFKTIIISIVGTLFFVFLFQNLASVTVNFLTFEVSMPRSLLLIIALAAGLLIGIFLPFGRKKTELGRNKKVSDINSTNDK